MKQEFYKKIWTWMTDFFRCPNENNDAELAWRRWEYFEKKQTQTENRRSDYVRYF